MMKEKIIIKRKNERNGHKLWVNSKKAASFNLIHDFYKTKGKFFKKVYLFIFFVKIRPYALINSIL